MVLQVFFGVIEHTVRGVIPCLAGAWHEVVPEVINKTVKRTVINVIMGFHKNCRYFGESLRLRRSVLGYVILI